jgi:hypothetical protein
MYGLKNDPEVREAIRLLNNEQEYKSLLIPLKKPIK